MRLNRVLALLGLAIATGIAIIYVEGQNLRLQQKLAEIHRQREKLIEEQSRLRLAISRLAAPAQLMEAVKDSDEPLVSPGLSDGVGPLPGMPPYLHRSGL